MGGSSDDGGTHGPYGQEILFLMSGLATGALVTYLISRFMKEVQYTVVLFLVGIAYAMCFKGDNDNVFINSVTIWSNINPHLILFIFLPALLFGDSLSMNFHHLKRTFLSSVLMAGPGAFLSAGLIALVGKYMLPEYEWSWNVCFIFGACLCSTDSVAVVSVLKDLKAQPSLTVFLIQSALLSEGTSLVLFNLFLNSLAKKKDGNLIGVGNVTSYCFQIILLSPLLGIGMGLLTVVCLKFANKRVLESDTVVQISITICCAYLSFYVGEGVFYLSGVLSCVSSGVVIAALSTVLILEHKTFFDVWEMIAWCSNTMIYLIAGLLFGSLSFTPTGYDVLSILIVYVMIHVIRSLTTLLFFPFLRSIGYRLTLKEGIFNVFTGLKGTMVMALSLVFTEYARDDYLEISAKEGDRIFFIVSGVSALSLLINGTFSASILQKLGLVESTEHSEETGIMHFYARRCIQKTVKEKIQKLNDSRLSSGHDSAIIERIEGAAVHADSPVGMRHSIFGRASILVQDNETATTATEIPTRTSLRKKSIAFFIDPTYKTTDSDDTNKSKRRSTIAIKNRSICYQTVGGDDDERDESDSLSRTTGIQIIPELGSVSGDVESVSSAESQNGIRQRIRRRVSVQYCDDQKEFSKSFIPGGGFDPSSQLTDENQINPILMKNVRRTFLEIVRSVYWKQIDNGTLPRSNNATSMTLYSVDYSLDFCGQELRDWEAIEKMLYFYKMPLIIKAIETIDYILSFFTGLPNYLNDIIEWHYCETLVYLLTSFIEAHENAQGIIPESFMEHISRNSRNGKSLENIQVLEEETILSESRRNVALAKAMLSTIDDDLIAFHITRQTTDIILRTQETEIEQLQQDGILCERDAEHLIEEVHRESDRIQLQSLNHIWRTRASASMTDTDAKYNVADFNSTHHWRELLPSMNLRSRVQN